MSGYWKNTKPLILASKSGVRYDMLQKIGIETEVIPANLDERAIAFEIRNSELAHEELASKLAIAKAKHVSTHWPDRYVLGADQILTQEGKEFHKVSTFSEAKAQLLALSGKTHQLIVAAALVFNGKVLFSVIDKAQLKMRPLSFEFTDYYIESAGDKILNSVGCYQIEGFGVHLFENIYGDQFTVMGMPLLKVLHEFRNLGLIVQ